MPHCYQLILLHQHQPDRARQLQQALRDQAAQLPVPDAILAIDINPPSPTTTDASTAIPRLVVFLADLDQAPGHALCQDIQAWLDNATPVMPIVRPDADFITVVPAALHKINAAPWQSGTPPDNHLLLDLLRRLGLAERERRLFLSYKRSDALEIVEPLWNALEKHGFDVFLDHYSLDRGINFQSDLMERLGDKAMVLLLESPQVSQSRWVAKEVDYAHANRLGLLALSWPEVLANARLQVNNIPPGYRLALAANDFVSSKHRRLEATAIKRICAEVERVHAQAMARRRRELLGSLLATINTEAPGAAYRWTGQWSLELRPSGSGGHPSADRYRVDVTPRPARSLDLFHCDQQDPNTPHNRAFLLHPTSQLSNERQRLLTWLQQHRQLDCITDTRLAPLLECLAP